MSYTRWNESGYYIWGGQNHVNFDGVEIEDDAIDVFLYKLYEVRGGDDEEFWLRYEHGKRIVKNFEKGFKIEKLTVYETENLQEKAAEIAALADEIWHEHFTPMIGGAQVDYMLAKFQSAKQIHTDIKKNEYVYFTARETGENRLIGYCAAVPKDGLLFQSKLYIHRDYRGKGIARAFFDEVTELCRWEYGYNKIRLTVNKNNDSAIAAYRKMGFETVDSVKTDIGEGFFMHDYVMEYRVPSVQFTETTK